MIPKEIDEPDMLYHKAVFSFGLGDVDVVSKDGTTLISKLQFTKGADHLLPTYIAAADLEHSSLVHADIDTLDTSQLLEGLDLVPSTLRAFKYGELGPKIRAMVDGPFINRVHKDFPYFRDAWYQTPARSRRMNAFCGCFLYVAVQTSMPDGTSNAFTGELSPHFDDRLTIDEESLDFHYAIEFNEYNDSFDQNG